MNVGRRTLLAKQKIEDVVEIPGINLIPFPHFSLEGFGKHLWGIQTVNVVFFLKKEVEGKKSAQQGNRNAWAEKRPQKARHLFFAPAKKLSGNKAKWQKELDVIMEKMSNTYELPPLDMIGSEYA